MSGESRAVRWMRTALSSPFAVDVVVAVALCGAALIDHAAHVWHDRGPVSILAILASLTAAYGAMLCRRRWPVATLATTVVAAEVYMTLSSLHWWVLPAPLISLYHLGATISDRRMLLTAGGLTALVLGGLPSHFLSTLAGDALWLRELNLSVTAACGLALAAGDGTRSRRAYLAAVEERAGQAERSRDQEAQRRVTEERLRIARDLHDSLGHHIAVINAQAGMAVHVFHDQPATALGGLTHIRQESRAALDGLRDTVGLLRQPGEPAAPAEPTVGISGISDLVASFRASGMPVEHEIDGTVRPLPPATDRTAYRIVQESLTNVGKHAAGGATARVQLSFQPNTLHIVVENEGNGRPRPTVDAPQDAQHSAGHGLVGMRERVASLGGSLEIGSRPDGGYRVNAVLPLTGGGKP